MAVCLDLPLLPSPSPPGVGERLDYHQWDLLKERKFYQDAGRGGRERRERGGGGQIVRFAFVGERRSTIYRRLASVTISRIYLGPVSYAGCDDGDGRYYTVRLSMFVPPESRRVSPTRFALPFLAIYCSPGPANSSSFLAARPFSHREYRKYSTKTRVRELENSLQRISIVKILFYYIVSFDVLSEILDNLY